VRLELITTLEGLAAMLALVRFRRGIVDSRHVPRAV
jgi:hypothetical protein